MKRFYWERGHRGVIGIYDRREPLQLPIATAWQSSIAEQIVEALNRAIGNVE